MGVSSEVDVVVIGVGTCGEDLSLRLLDAGLRVVGIEAELVGGECAYWGCLPTKKMIRAANLLQESRRVGDFAGQTKTTSDWALVAEHLRTSVTGGWDDSFAVTRFNDRGGRLVHGYGRLVGPAAVAVGEESFTAKKGIVIATGSRPWVPSIPGLARTDYWTTRDVIKLESLPSSVMVLGGGAVACELGQVLARFGVAVTIVEAQPRLLPNEEPEAAAVLQRAFDAAGIVVRTGAAATHVAQTGTGFGVTLDDGSKIVAEQLLVAAGRRVDTSELGLDKAGIDHGTGAIPVDDRMKAADKIWAMGDVTEKGLFTHVALYQAAVVAADILGETVPAARYHAVPRVTFTDPEVGSVGMTEAEARAADVPVVTIVKQLPATFRGWLHTVGNDGVIKLVVNADSGVVVGATTVGPHGGEMLGLLGLAVHAELPLSALQSMIYAFPTFSGSIGEAVGAYGRGLGTVLDPDFVPPDRLPVTTAEAATS